jgi:hypothetical protein
MAWSDCTEYCLPEYLLRKGSIPRWPCDVQSQTYMRNSFHASVAPQLWLDWNAQITFGILIPQWMRRSLLTPTLRKFPGWRLQLNFLHQSSRRNQEGNAEARNPYLTITLKDFRSILDTYTQSHFLNHSLACSLASSAAFASTSAPGLALTAKPCATPLYVLIW